MKRVLFYSVCLTTVLSGMTSFALAQSDANSSFPSQFPDLIQEQIEVTQTPDIGEPFGPMTVSIDAYGTDLNAAEVDWSLNGKKIHGGIGDKSLSFTLGARGQASIVKVTIQPSNGLPITKTVSITPEDVDLLWQSDSYTPPFYQGKALFPPQGTITFLAIPEFVVNGKHIDPKNLVYKWLQDTTVLGNQSGYGKNSITVNGSVVARGTDIQVDVSTTDGSYVARQLLTVNPNDPQVFMYENNPLYGILFNRAVQNTFTLNKEEVQFEAYPYFFSTRSRASADLSYNWLMNGDTINVPPSQHSMLFRNVANQTGTSRVSLLVTSATKILQNATNNFAVTFNQVTKNFFGQ